MLVIWDFCGETCVDDGFSFALKYAHLTSMKLGCCLLLDDRTHVGWWLPI